MIIPEIVLGPRILRSVRDSASLKGAQMEGGVDREHRSRQILLSSAGIQGKIRHKTRGELL